MYFVGFGDALAKNLIFSEGKTVKMFDINHLLFISDPVGLVMKSENVILWLCELWLNYKSV